MNTERRITDSVIIERIEGLTKLIDERFINSANERGLMLKQLIKINGCIADLVIRVHKLEEWKNKIIGALITINLIVIPLTIILLKNNLRR